MSDIKKLNGYNIKDSEARNSINTINTNISTINGSINTINNTLNNESTGLVARVTKLENEKYLLTGTFDGSEASAQVISTYPADFTINNTLVLSFMKKLSTQSVWTSATNIVMPDNSVAPVPMVTLTQNNIGITDTGAAANELIYDYKIMIMKIDTAPEELPE